MIYIICAAYGCPQIAFYTKVYVLDLAWREFGGGALLMSC